MATVISKEEFDAHAGALIDRAWAGEEIVVEQSGAPKLRLVPVSPQAGRASTFGVLRGKITVPPSAFEPLPEAELRAWEGE